MVGNKVLNKLRTFFKNPILRTTIKKALNDGQSAKEVNLRIKLEPLTLVNCVTNREKRFSKTLAKRFLK